MPDIWETSATELLHIFRSAIISLIPSMNRCHISWNSDESYDDWDDITRVLYNSIVVKSLTNSNIHVDSEDQVLRYNSFDFTDRSVFILVYQDDSINMLSTIKVFHEFSTSEGPFDTVGYRVYSHESGQIQGEIEFIELNQVKFGVAVKGEYGIDVIDNLTIRL